MLILSGLIGLAISGIANRTTSYQNELIKIYKDQWWGRITVEEMCKRTHELDLKYHKFGRLVK